MLQPLAQLDAANGRILKALLGNGLERGQVHRGQGRCRIERGGPHFCHARQVDILDGGILEGVYPNRSQSCGREGLNA